MSSETCPDIEKAARRLLPGLKTDASMLMANWPTVPGTLPFSGQYWADKADPDSIFILGDSLRTDPPLPVTEWATSSVWKAESGGLRFDLETVGTKVEYHPAAGTPASFVTSVRYCGKEGKVEHVMKRYVRLEPHWFLAWYLVVDL
jgi:hypothetical protein